MNELESTALAGHKILAVEDESLVAMFLEDVLIDLGCVCVGPVGRVQDALSLLNDTPIDAAVLDVNVAGEQVFPVANRLAELNAPFIFATGYGEAGLPDAFHSRIVLQKPYSAAALQKALEQCLRESSGAQG